MVKKRYSIHMIPAWHGQVGVVTQQPVERVVRVKDFEDLRAKPNPAMQSMAATIRAVVAGALRKVPS